jgi:hypothetical protein
MCGEYSEDCADDAGDGGSVVEHLPTMLNYTPSNFPFEVTSTEFGQDYSQELSLLRDGAESQTEEQAAFFMEHQQMAQRALQNSMPGVNDSPLSVVIYVLDFLCKR